MPGPFANFGTNVNQILSGMSPMNYAGGLIDPTEALQAQRQAQLTQGATMLQAAGPSPYPVSAGQGFGAALMRAQAAQNGAIDDSLKRKLVASETLKNLFPQETGINSRFRTPLMTTSNRAVTFDGQTGQARYADTGQPWDGSKDPLNKIQIVRGEDGSVQQVQLGTGGIPGPAQGGAAPPAAGAPPPAAPAPGVRPVITAEQAAVQNRSKAHETTQGGIEANRDNAAPEAYSKATEAIAGMKRFADQAALVANHPGLDKATGFGGETISGVAGTPAADAAAQILTLKSQSFTGALQAMREASKTGGAVGNVSNMEGDKLESTWVALKQSQSPAQYRENLARLQSQLQQSTQRIQAAYNREYGARSKGAPVFQAPPAALDYLRQHPDASGDFRDKFGYLP